jgi:type IV secretory pathway VirB3-like protein
VTQALPVVAVCMHCVERLFVLRDTYIRLVYTHVKKKSSRIKFLWVIFDSYTLFRTS